MSAPIILQKSKADIDRTNVTLTVTDAIATSTGQSFVDNLRDRKNSTGWGTTGSTDAAGTIVEFDIPDSDEINYVMLVDHNFKSYDLEYWNGSSWINIVSITGNAESTTVNEFASVSPSKVRVVINSTFTVDADKFMAQFVVTKKIGQFVRHPEISGVEISQERKASKMISGKTSIQKHVGAFSCELEFRREINDHDLTMVETMSDSPDGFLVWLAGDNTDQFRTVRFGYRRKDIFLMDFADEYQPILADGSPNRGHNVKISLTELAFS